VTVAAIAGDVDPRQPSRDLAEQGDVRLYGGGWLAAAVHGFSTKQGR
jgi:hypothetical protein